MKHTPVSIIHEQATNFCVRTCDYSSHPNAGCCDTLWLPHIDMSNLLEFDYSSKQPRWRIWVDGKTNATVHWSVRLDASWFSPFAFRAWPLEHQHLLMEFQLPPSISSSVSISLGSVAPLANAPHIKGVDLAGWWISNITPRLYNTSACFSGSKTSTAFFSLDDNTPMLDSYGPGQWADPHPSPSTVVTTVEPSQCSATSNYEAIAGYSPYILVVDTQVG